jgi:hypothetical protein
VWISSNVDAEVRSSWRPTRSAVRALSSACQLDAGPPLWTSVALVSVRRTAVRRITRIAAASAPACAAESAKRRGPFRPRVPL